MMAGLGVGRNLVWGFVALWACATAAPHYNVYLGSSLPSSYPINNIQPLEKLGWPNGKENLKSAMAMVDEELGRSNDYGIIMLESGEEDDAFSRLLQNIQGQELILSSSDEGDVETANWPEDAVNYDVVYRVSGDVTADAGNHERLRRMAKKSKEKNPETRPSKERKGSKEKNNDENSPARTKRMAKRGGKRGRSRERCIPEGDTDAGGEGRRSRERKRSRERHRHGTRERHGPRSRERCLDDSTTSTTTTTTTTTPSTTTSSTTTTTSSTTTTPTTTTTSTTTTPTTTTTTTSTTPSTTTTSSTPPSP